MNKNFNPMTFLRNLKWSFLRNGVEDYLALEQRVTQLENSIRILQPSRAEFQDLLLLEAVVNCDDPRFSKEADFCRRHARLKVFPYEKTRDFPTVDVHFDCERSLPYVLHANKRLYYPADWGHGRVAYSYLNTVAEEGILGNGCLEKSPHNYVNECFPVKAGAVVCDFGAAEGLMALHFAEQASQLVIGECDRSWMDALRATFRPYSEKTTFVTEPLGMGADGMAFSHFLPAPATAHVPFFIKFDIEGAERFAIREAEEFFKTHEDVTVACAAYHRQDDAQILEEMFRGWGYETAFSEGAMLFLLDRLAPPYFRRGVLHAKKG